MEWTTACATKVCSKCGQEKPATTQHFHTNKGGRYGLQSQCISCRRAIGRESIRRPDVRAKRIANQAAYSSSGRSAARGRRWRSQNLEKARASTAAWKLRNPDRVKAADKTWRDANREKVRAKQRRSAARLKQKPEYVLKRRIKARLRQMLKGTCVGATGQILGYTQVQLKAHIERQFTEGMNWDRLMAGEIPYRSHHPSVGI